MSKILSLFKSKSPPNKKLTEYEDETLVTCKNDDNRLNKLAAYQLSDRLNLSDFDKKIFFRVEIGKLYHKALFKIISRLIGISR